MFLVVPSRNIWVKICYYASMTFTVKTETFEGPLGLLLKLIEERKLPVHEISLAEVTDAYLDYLREMKEQSLGDISQFITIAGTLILIKSRSLLPTIELTEEEEESIEDLETRLKLFQAMQTVMPHIAEGIKRTSSFPLADYSKRDTGIVFAPDRKNMLPAQLILVARELIKEINTLTQELPQTDVAPTIKIEELMQTLEHRILSQDRISFRTLTGNLGARTPKEQRVYVIVSFLAMLEMVRNGIIDVVQQTDGDITITKN